MILALMDSVSAGGFHFGKGSKIPSVTLLPRHEDFSPKAAEILPLLPKITMLGRGEQLMSQLCQRVMLAIYRRRLSDGPSGSDGRRIVPVIN